MNLILKLVATSMRTTPKKQQFHLSPSSCVSEEILNIFYTSAIRNIAVSRQKKVDQITQIIANFTADMVMA